MIRRKELLTLLVSDAKLGAAQRLAGSILPTETVNTVRWLLEVAARCRSYGLIDASGAIR